MSKQDSKLPGSQSMISSLAGSQGSTSIIEKNASDLLKKGSGLTSILAPLSLAAQKTVANRAQVLNSIHESAADLVRARAIADREVAEAESTALHDQTRSLLLIRHREQHDELHASARTDLIRGMTSLLEQKTTALVQLEAIDGDPELKSLAAAAIASTYDTGLKHMANNFRKQSDSGS